MDLAAPQHSSAWTSRSIVSGKGSLITGSKAACKARLSRRSNP
jgi:hypothetical protein